MKSARAALLAVALLALAGRAANAQEIPTPLPLSVSVPDANVFLARQASLPGNPFLPAAQDYQGLPVGEWRLYPMLYSGFSFNDNLLNTNNQKIADGAWNVTPTIVATRDQGVQNTAIYGTLTTTNYFQHPDADFVVGRLGFQHLWEARRDLVFNFAGGITRSEDLSNGGGALNTVTFLPIYDNTYKISAAAFKSFDRVFSNTTVALSNRQYDNATLTDGASLPQSYRDYAETLVRQRFGFDIGPVFYLFSDTSVNWRNTYNSPESASQGYRQTIGLGSLRFGLTMGEIFAGYQAQDYKSRLIGDVSDPVIGGRLVWSPRAYLSFSGTLDETIATQDFVTPANPLPSAVKTLTATLGVHYAPNHRWSLSLNAGYGHDAFSNSTRRDDSFNLGATLNYYISSKLVASLCTRQVVLNSSYTPASYASNITSIGLRYRY
ncbi:outer membrane beta-barrel protein [Rhodoblastus acidophilus]|nr:outer membrane beta-barrel protein [Rhodoblastus acidophilus]